jgi:hypothetical protein
MKAESSKYGKLSLLHLQLDSGITRELRQIRCQSIDDVLRLPFSRHWQTLSGRSEVNTALAALTQCVQGFEINWLKYWKLRDFVFNNFCATSTELDRLSTEYFSRKINVKGFGQIALTLNRAGIFTVEDLVIKLKLGVENIQGIGPARVRTFFKWFIPFLLLIDKNGYSKFFDYSFEPNASSEMPIRNGMNLEPFSLDKNSAISKLPIGLLHMGVKTMHLRKSGITNIGELLDASELSLYLLSNIGKDSANFFMQRAQTLLRNKRQGDTVDWDGFCREIGTPLIPQLSKISDGQSFITELPNVIKEIASKLNDPVEQNILYSRVLAIRTSRSTLEEIAQRLDLQITRQAVRFKEEALLQRISAALVFDHYDQLDLHFKPEYSGYWKRIAAHFSETDAIDSFKFVLEVAELLNVEIIHVARVARILLIFAIGKVVNIDDHAGCLLFEPKAYGITNSKILSLKINFLGLGRHSEDIIHLGFNTFDDLIRASRNGYQITKDNNVALKKCALAVAQLCDSIDESGNVNWESYAKLSGLALFPINDRCSIDDVVKHIVVDLRELLIATIGSKNYVDIFTLRIARDSETRLSIGKVAKVLNVFDSEVKRIETRILKGFVQQLTQHEFSKSSVIFRINFLEIWECMLAIYEMADGDYALFKKQLIAQSIESKHVDESSYALIWAVFKGAPGGRAKIKFGRPELPFNMSQKNTLGFVKLRGFSRPH